MKKKSSVSTSINTNLDPSIPNGCKIIKNSTFGEVNLTTVKDLLPEGQFNKLAAIVLGKLIDSETKLAPASILDWYLSNQEEIPKKYKKIKLCFWGTIFQGDNHIFIKQLCWVSAEKKYDWRKVDIFSNYVHDDLAAILD